MIDMDGRDFGDINKDDAINILRVLDEYFDAKWLNGNSEHRFVNLIKRKDYYSTVELINFAHALSSLNCNADLNTKNWLREQCKLVKGKDVNNSNAAFFEILILGFLNSDNYIVKPAPKGNKGYDGTIIYENSDTINVSVKNYKNTKYNDIFNNMCKELDSRIYSYFKKIKLSYDINIFIEEYPDNFEDSCDDIANEIEEHVKKNIGKTNEILINIEKTKCNVMLKLFAPEELSKNISHRLFIACKHHKNEKKNLLDKIQNAVDNISKYSQSSSKTRNYVIIHINDVLKISDVSSIIKEGINFRDVYSIILLQPLITREFNRQDIHINYFFDMITANGTNATGHNIHLNIFCGEPTSSFPQNILVVDGKQYILEDYYIFTKGEIFKTAHVIDNSQMENLYNYESGVYYSSVVKMNNNIFIARRKHMELDKFEFL